MSSPPPSYAVIAPTTPSSIEYLVRTSSTAAPLYASETYSVDCEVFQATTVFIGTFEECGTHVQLIKRREERERLHSLSSSRKRHHEPALESGTSQGEVDYSTRDENCGTGETRDADNETSLALKSLSELFEKQENTPKLKMATRKLTKAASAIEPNLRLPDAPAVYQPSHMNNVNLDFAVDVKPSVTVPNRELDYPYCSEEDARRIFEATKEHRTFGRKLERLLFDGHAERYRTISNRRSADSRNRLEWLRRAVSFFYPSTGEEHERDQWNRVCHNVNCYVYKLNRGIVPDSPKTYSH